nr:MAG TPA: zinc finger domain-containing protein [Caudoviricetes sp.]
MVLKAHPSDHRYIFLEGEKGEISKLQKHLNKIPTYQLLPNYPSMSMISHPRQRVVISCILVFFAHILPILAPEAAHYVYDITPTSTCGDLMYFSVFCSYPANSRSGGSATRCALKCEISVWSSPPAVEISYVIVIAYHLTFMK